MEIVEEKSPEQPSCHHRLIDEISFALEHKGFLDWSCTDGVHVLGSDPVIQEACHIHLAIIHICMWTC